MSFEPKLLGFLCQNSADICADFAGMEQKSYTPNFLPLRLPCLGSMDALTLLWAYYLGADGVLVVGCLPGQCHHKFGNGIAKRRVEVIQGLLEILGIGKERLNLSWVHSSEITKFLEIINGFNENLIKMGPSPILQPRDAETFHWMNEFRKCDQCHQCKEVCPVCFCKKCYVESFPNFGMGWLVHVMERCTGCGACKDICPQGIHLFEIVKLLQLKIPNLNTLPQSFPLPKGSEKVGAVNITK